MSPHASFKIEDKTIFGWVFSGHPQNWKFAFRRNIWGLKTSHRPLWQKIMKGDMIFFYATKPVGGVIGVARAERIFEEKEPYWPDEIAEGRVKYPLRVEFKPLEILGEDCWEEKRVSIKHLGPIFFHGINALMDKELFKRLFETICESMTGLRCKKEENQAISEQF